MSPDQIATKADVDAVMKALSEVKQLLANVAISQPDEWLSIPQAAAHLGCSESTIRRKIDTGEFVAKGAGKSRRVKL
jgi:excisionase family DNA binding protein